MVRKIWLVALIVPLFFLFGSESKAEWKTVDFPPPNPNSTLWYLTGVQAIGPNEAWFSGTDEVNGKALMLYYLNGSFEYVSLPSFSTPWGVNSIHFPSRDEGWGAGGKVRQEGGQAGVLLQYSNKVWTSITAPENVYSLLSIRSTRSNDNTTVWAVGMTGSPSNQMGVIVKYTPSTGQMDSISPDIGSNFWWLYDVHFVSEGEGWAVGRDVTNHRGVMLHYRSGVWTPVDLPNISSEWELMGVHFPSSDEGWAVGRNHAGGKGIMLHYKNGSWSVVDLPSLNWGNGFLSKIYFTSRDEGWAVGTTDNTHEGILLSYYRGSWTSISSPAVLSGILYTLHFNSPGNGWIVGRHYPTNGIILRYTSDSCLGFEPPCDSGPIKVKKNRVIPLKAQLINPSGVPITGGSISAPPVVQVMFQSGTSSAVDVSDQVLSSGQGTEGNQFVYHDGKWQFNLSTKNYSAIGTYTVTMQSGNSAEYNIQPTCTMQFVIEE